MRIAAVLVAALSCPVRTSAQPQESMTPIDPRAVDTFAGEFIPVEMARRQIPGAVFVFVAGGEIAVACGFGAAQLDPRRPVDPDRTVFRLASVSKTITATAALQLVESGRLDLHTDVNKYLRSFQLAAQHGPITLHHLLTHTAGFDERLTGAAARSFDEVKPSARYLAESMPPTFIAPGRVISYSNHGFALVGHLVEEVSGRPFAEYVRQEIFEPLGMLRSGSMTARIPEEFAIAYEFEGGQHRALAPDYLQVSSAGSFFTTGTDMGRFLIAQLRGGAYHDRRILRPETVELMHAQHFVQLPDTSGWAYGWWEDTRNNQRALLHNGGGKGFRAQLYLLPAQGAGFFLAYNLADRHEEGELLEVFTTQFRQRFVPGPQRVGQAAFEPEATERFTGDYLYVRRARTTPEKMIAIVNRVRIGRAVDGALTMTRGADDAVSLRPIGPRLFRRADDRGVVGFDAIVDGSPNRLVAITDSGFPAVYERIPLILTLRAQAAWALGMALVFLYAAVWRPLAGLVRRTRTTGWNLMRWSTWFSSVAAALNLVFLIGFPLAFLGRIEGGTPAFLYGVPTLAAVLLIIPPVTAMLSVAAAIAVAGMWRDAGLSLAVRLEHMLVTCALLGFVAFAVFWNVMVFL
jgi:CubicO group peptidase (beta-lactamase class C family)